MTPRELLLHTVKRFRAAGIPDPETDAALLLSPLCGSSPLTLRLDTETPLEPALLNAYEALVLRRLRREPLQYILGTAPFCGLSIRVDRRVLIPRPETEELCCWVSESLQNLDSPSVLDLCCGSGCIGLALKSYFPHADIHLSDLSEDAVSVSALNAELLHLSVSLHHGDLLNCLPDRFFHMIVCNPPYIPAAECPALQPEVLWEPRCALDGGRDGLDFYRRIVLDAPRVLLPDGLLFMELGSGEAESVMRLLHESGWKQIAARNDIHNIRRMIRAVRP